jgi:hypothetical protein
MNKRMLNPNKQYADEMPKLMEYLKDTLTDSFNNDVRAEVYEVQSEELECRSRDGFMPFDHNRGGVRILGFSDVRCIMGSGTIPNNKQASKAIEGQDTQNREYALEALNEKHGTKFTTNDNLPEDMQNELWEIQDEGSSEDSILFYIQAKYEGSVNGVHTLYVTACINWESPYHRSHISWLPDFVTESSKSVEIKFKNATELRTRLKKALKQVTVIF